jgi:hypothetical protein
MESPTRLIKRILIYAVTIFIFSFLWNYFTRDNLGEILKSAFAVFLTSLFGVTIVEIAYRYYTK